MKLGSFHFVLILESCPCFFLSTVVYYQYPVDVVVTVQVLLGNVPAQDQTARITAPRSQHTVGVDIYEPSLPAVSPSFLPPHLPAYIYPYTHQLQIFGESWGSAVLMNTMTMSLLYSFAVAIIQIAQYF